ncbi:hypothetical protein CG709_11645 [Lachnotalea glycerini]|uniref:DUF6870 domain-containing protein n=2 Tax=Lachnotalea glycerini TaxID=1763509 RepID=A0A371JAZ0_9FIRM|nr:hypothetical protein [Lachnotalea glycerini]OYO99964.1 hypothetical protein CG709_11645 [Lachnotalea glycerini]RDY29930.1 hypothetical protein CG710_017300 [Lachnotalea glycerini]
MIMITIEQLDAMKSVDLRTINKDVLVNVQDFQFDNSLSKQERVKRVIERTKNPYCFRYGQLGVKIEFTDGGPALGDLLTDFFLRKKSGL